jgi:hypothetical protein
MLSPMNVCMLALALEAVLLGFICFTGAARAGHLYGLLFGAAALLQLAALALLVGIRRRGTVGPVSARAPLLCWITAGFLLAAVVVASVMAGDADGLVVAVVVVPPFVLAALLAGGLVRDARKAERRQGVRDESPTSQEGESKQIP